MQKWYISLLVILLIASCKTVPVEDPAPIIEPEKTLFEEHIKGALKGIIRDEIQIGIAYETGDGISQDYLKAHEWYRKAAEKGDPEAYFRIGLLYEQGRGVPSDQDSAVEWFLSAAVNDYSPAIRKLIDFFDFQPEEQKKWVAKGLELNDPYSLYHSGLAIEEQDRKRAINLFIDAKEADSLHSDAMVAILSMGGKTDLYTDKEAVEVITRSAERNNSRSQTFLAWLYELGIGVQRDLEKAIRLYEEASKDYNQLAIYGISRLKDIVKSEVYFQQLDLDQFSPSFYDLYDLAKVRDSKEELEILYRFKASQGDIESQYELALILDGEEALPWFWLSAQEGHIPSMIELGYRYETLDPVQSAVWLMMAENNGFEEGIITSRQILENLTDEDKMEVSRLFTEFFFSD